MPFALCSSEGKAGLGNAVALMCKRVSKKRLLNDLSQFATGFTNSFSQASVTDLTDIS